MRRTVLVVYGLLFAVGASAATVYQCVGSNGHPIFSDQPCGAAAVPFDVAPAPYIGTVSTYALDRRIVDQGLHEANQRSISRSIDLRQQANDSWRGAMNADMDRLTIEQANTTPDLDGALRAQQLAIDKQTTVNQYNARIDANDRAITDLQNQLDR